MRAWLSAFRALLHVVRCRPASCAAASRRAPRRRRRDWQSPVRARPAGGSRPSAAVWPTHPGTQPSSLTARSRSARRHRGWEKPRAHGWTNDLCSVSSARRFCALPYGLIESSQSLHRRRGMASAGCVMRLPLPGSRLPARWIALVSADQGGSSEIQTGGSQAPEERAVDLTAGTSPEEQPVSPTALVISSNIDSTSLRERTPPRPRIRSALLPLQPGRAPGGIG